MMSWSGCLALLLLLAATVGQAAAPTPAPAGYESIAWPSGVALKWQLAQPISVQWAEGPTWPAPPLRKTLLGLSRANRVAIVIDRRVDPDQKLNLSLRNVPLEDVLRQAAASLGLGMTKLGPVIYFGPLEYTARLRTLAEMHAEEVRALPYEAGRKLTQSDRLAWNDFATPREILGQMAEKSRLQIVGLERVPHDLWAAAELPPLPLVDRLTLLLGQFDLSFQVSPDGDSITLAPLPARVAIVRSYSGGAGAEQLAAKWAAEVPQCEVKASGGKVYVRGLLEDQERIAALSRPGGRPSSRPPKTVTHPPAKVGNSAQRFTMRARPGPLRVLLEQLAFQMQLELKIDEEAIKKADISLDQTVSFAGVENASFDELWTAALKSTGCTYRHRGNTLWIVPARKDEGKK
jgi:hypothetical protein